MDKHFAQVLINYASETGCLPRSDDDIGPLETWLIRRVLELKEKVAWYEKKMEEGRCTMTKKVGG